MKTTHLEINHDASGKVWLTQGGNAVGTVIISETNDLEINPGDGFGSHSHVTGIGLYTDVDHSKGTLVGNWSRDNTGSQPSSDIAISAHDHHVTIKDVNPTGVDQTFFFSVTATDGKGKNYSTDPELIVKRKRSG